MTAMRYLDRLRAEPSLLLLVAMVGGLAAIVLYMALSSITY
nr:hypothetical protein [Mesorhizobium sp.]